MRLASKPAKKEAATTVQRAKQKGRFIGQIKRETKKEKRATLHARKQNYYSRNKL